MLLKKISKKIVEKALAHHSACFTEKSIKQEQTERENREREDVRETTTKA